MSTLLEKAKAFPAPRDVTIEKPLTREHVELVMAYLNGELTVRQCAAALEMTHPGSFSNWLGSKLKRMYQENLIDIVSKS